jgi:hypothetical protein
MLINIKYTVQMKSLLYHNFGDLSVENVSDLIVYIYTHSALTGVQVLVTRTPEHAH